MSVIVSLTSWKPRFPIVIDAISSILSGSTLPDRIVLVVSRDDVPYLPEDVKVLASAQQLEILEYDDIGSHKKLLPVMNKYPDADIITIDDDWIYGVTFVESLLKYHNIYPKDVLCNWCLRIKANKYGNVESYRHWEKFVPNEYGDIDLFPMSGAGALWPAHCFDKSKPDLTELDKCPNADDIYNKVLMIRNGIIARKVPCDCHQSYANYDIVAETALSKINVSAGANNVYIQNFVEYSNLIQCISKLPVSRVDTTHYGLSIKINEIKNRLTDELHTKCADKILVKTYCSEILGTDEYTVPTIGIYDTVDEIPKDLSNVIIKCNHGSMMNRVFKGTIAENKDALNSLASFMNIDYSSKYGEMQYKNITRRLIVEPILPNPIDIKVYMASGKIVLFQVNNAEKKLRMFFDNKLRQLDEKFIVTPKPSRTHTTVYRLDKIFKRIRPIAEKISSAFDFVRVDFLYSENNLYINELTFTPFAGNIVLCDKYDRTLGDAIFIARPNKWKTEILLLTKYLNRADLDEWLNWHINVQGIEHVHIFDNNNTYDIRPVVEKYGAHVSYESIVEHPRQYDLYNRYISYQSEAEWVLAIDDDEYLDIDKTMFQNAYDMIVYYQHKFPDLKVLAMRWKHLFPKILHSERKGKVLDYCTENTKSLALLCGSGDRGVKSFVKRDSAVHYEESYENPSGGHVPKHRLASNGLLCDGTPITTVAMETERTIDDEHVRVLHCRYKGFSDWNAKYRNIDSNRNCKRVCDRIARNKKVRLDSIIDITP